MPHSGVTTITLRKPSSKPYLELTEDMSEVTFKMVKKLIASCFLSLFIITAIYGVYEMQKPLLTKQEALAKARLYLDSVNHHLDLNYRTDSIPTYIILDNDTLWNRATGNTVWDIYIDDTLITIDADTGKFNRIIFPTDITITRGEHPDWF